MVFGRRTRTAATARPGRPSDGKNRWVTEIDAELYGRPILTEFNGLISSAKGEAVRRLAARLTSTPNGGTIPALLDG